MNWRQIRIGADGTQSPGWAPALTALGRAALDLVIPLTAHDGEAAQSPGLSAQAWRKITFLSDPACDGCGQPYEYETGLRCAACQSAPSAFDRARAACLYDEHSRELILQLKHADRPELGRLLALWINRAAAPLVEDCEVIVPVPMHPGRLFRRRYNQAAEIARPLSRLSGKPYLADALVRQRDTGTQGGKSAAGRRRNVAGAFAVSRAARIEGRRVLLVDDVLTTGATAHACARALKAAGAACVDLAVAARVEQSPLRAI